MQKLFFIRLLGSLFLLSSLSLHAQESSVPESPQTSELSCHDFENILNFVQSEHLRFRSPNVSVNEIVQFALDNMGELMRERGFHMLAAQYESQMKKALQSPNQMSWPQLCRALSASYYREFFLKSFMKQLDPYSEFYTDDELPRRTNVVDGHFVGVGVGTNEKDPYLEVTEVVEGGPSEKQLKVGDLISHVDGKSVRGLTSEELRMRIRGELGTQVEFRGLREGSAFQVKITRGHVYQKSVSSEFMDSGILKIKIHRFYAHTAAQMEALLKHHQNAKALILDLRDNPGGLLQGARDVVDLFVSDGVVVYLRGIYEDQITAIQEGVQSHLPMVVLINERSASASEIVAGALQDYGRAILVGRPTFGKSCVQNIYETQTALGTEYRGGLKLTTLWFYLPSGRASNTIQPDVLVAASSDETSKRNVMPYEWPQRIAVNELPHAMPFREVMKNTFQSLGSVSEFEETSRNLLEAFLTQSANSEE